MISLFGFGSKYDDEEILQNAEDAIRQHPLLKLANYRIACEDGVVQLSAYNGKEKKAMIEIENRLKSNGVEYESIDLVNEDDK